MIEDANRQYWLKLGGIALVSFLAAFLAFYIVMDIMFDRLDNQDLDVKDFVKLIKQEQRDMRKYEDILIDSPFVPRIRPMVANLVKEVNEYKIIIDLEQLNGDENAVNVEINGNELFIKGHADKKKLGTEKMVSFIQTYYLDEKVEENKMKKERKGEKLIITLPFDD